MPGAIDKLITVTRTINHVWWRPFTTLGLAAFERLFEPVEQIK